MSSTAVAKASPDIQTVHICVQDVRVHEVQMPHQPRFTVEAAGTWRCEEASISVTRSVALHTPEEQARQQRTPLGAHKAGTVHIVAEGRVLSPAAHDTSATSSSISSRADAAVFPVPLYAARVSYQRPNRYKEHWSLCIVEGPQNPTALSRPQFYCGARRHSRSRGLERSGDKPTRVLFIDVAALTPDARASLRCTSTEEISIPTALYFRCASASSSLPTSASTKNNGKLQVRHGPGHSAWDRSQQRRRRVILLPPTAAGKTFELVCISVKRGRDE
ncbi:hypothetical protein, unknown function [Leishmania infantum JPCM5]|uniref:Uncharacterized protein n=2 Tax=Leishmania infantum TaxID=5671 RepID=A4I4Q0_LEIIN|nr:hypothetical protein, unknown function [Leishmania infantum JPCM5]CAC9509575.1 hypothetical_protein_-_conserved [Leishmania infantum]CAM69763.1 hypothetical protein, unknown function [Leishmania infantum JPCM5]SUZ43714.1 hypothetical_protein_-_conserved [Leishmania infantum]|eukprot:XP_001466719.1 hypothetical protein, unknown function [Leishmania infantum JPCM5]